MIRFFSKGLNSWSFFSVVILFIIVTVAISAYARFLYFQEYTFYVEAACDPEIENCYIRSCEDYCPPNELEVYKAFYIPANVFAQCTDNSCENICSDTTSGPVCEEIPCEADEETECSQ